MINVAAWIAAGGESIAAALAGEGSHEVETVWRWNVVAVGGERRSSAAAWAEHAGAQEAAGLRELARPGVGVVVSIGNECPSSDDLRHLLDGERRVIVVAARPPTLELLASLGDRAGRLDVVPTFIGGHSMALAEALLAEFRQEAAPVAISVRMRCPSGQGSVDGLLFDACLAIVSVTGNVESVLALRRSLADPSEPEVVVAVARCSDGALVTIDVADGGGWHRSIEFLSQQGRCVIGDHVIERTDPTGAVRERHEPRGATSLVDAARDSLRRLAAPGQARDASRLYRDAIAVADAARLSARTGNPESPARVLELAVKP